MITCSVNVDDSESMMRCYKLFLELSCINIIKVENNISARNYHVSKVVITALVNHGAQNRGLSVEEAFGIQTKVMTKVRDAIWC